MPILIGPICGIKADNLIRKFVKELSLKFSHNTQEESDWGLQHPVVYRRLLERDSPDLAHGQCDLRTLHHRCVDGG